LPLIRKLKSEPCAGTGVPFGGTARLPRPGNRRSVTSVGHAADHVLGPKRHLTAGDMHVVVFGLRLRLGALRGRERGGADEENPAHMGMVAPPSTGLIASCAAAHGSADGSLRSRIAFRLPAAVEPGPRRSIAVSAALFDCTPVRRRFPESEGIAW